MNKENLTILGTIVLTCIILYLIFKLLAILLPIGIAVIILGCMIIFSSVVGFY